MLVKQKEKTMKFIKVETQQGYLVWERQDNDMIVITKTKGTKDYWVENLETGDRFCAMTLETAKAVGCTY
jgi:frataxin-like iron-binding protein CyaY